MFFEKIRHAYIHILVNQQMSVVQSLMLDDGLRGEQDIRLFLTCSQASWEERNK